MTRSTAAQGARFRQRKLSTKQSLQILREDQVEKIDDDAQRNIPKVETGVEKGEELEHHLQAAISASQAAAIGSKVAQSYIPTPDAIVSSLNYGELYPQTFVQPATYIKFSSTVEECVGSLYCMEEEDEAALKLLNQRRHTPNPCSSDQFEEVMNFFEETANATQKYAWVDNAPILSLDALRANENYEEAVSPGARQYAEDIYEHWKARRSEAGNRSVQPSLKFETGRESDDSDPYVCFRRREIRQVRKTRARDNQSVATILKMKEEIMTAKRIAALHRQKQIATKENMVMARQLFEQRRKIKEVKRKLGIKGDDEDLVNQKPKKKIIEPTIQAQQRMLSSAVRYSQRPTQTAEDLQLFEDVQAEKEEEVEKDIRMKVVQHGQWNTGYVDWTNLPLTPIAANKVEPRFRAAATEYLPTPPASVSSEPSQDADADVEMPDRDEVALVPVRYSSPTEDAPMCGRPSFRRRYGRGGRMMIDRRGLANNFREGIDEIVIDRFKYDHDEEDEPLVFDADPYDTFHMRYRAHYFDRAREAAQQAQAAKRIQGDATTQAIAVVPAASA